MEAPHVLSDGSPLESMYMTNMLHFFFMDCQTYLKQGSSTWFLGAPGSSHGLPNVPEGYVLKIKPVIVPLLLFLDQLH